MGLAVGATGIGSAGPAMADIVLSDGNTTVTFDTIGGDDILGDGGMDSWVVDGVDHLYQQWFWLGIGNNDEFAINELNQLGLSVTDSDFLDPGVDQLVVLYGDGNDAVSSDLLIQIKFSLNGGQPGDANSDIAEQIEIINQGPDDLTLRFYQYSDFDLHDSSGNDTLVRTNNNTWRQTDPSGVSISETIVTPIASHFEAAAYSDLLDRFEDGDATELADIGGPLSGDVTWGFQWNIQLSPDTSYLISKDKSIQVPAPGAAILAGLGFSMVGWVRRRFA